MRAQRRHSNYISSDSKLFPHECAFFHRRVESPQNVWLNRIKHPVLLCFNNFKYNLMSIHKKEHSGATPSLFLFEFTCIDLIQIWLHVFCFGCCCMAEEHLGEWWMTLTLPYIQIYVKYKTLLNSNQNTLSIICLALVKNVIN